MIKRIFHKHTNRNFSIATMWIKGGSNLDCINKKGINNILCSLLTRGCEGYENLKLADFIEYYGAELNHEVVEDGISISIKSLNEHFNKLLPLLNLMIEKPLLSLSQYKKVKKISLNALKKDKENQFNICFDRWRKIVYSKHPYAFNTLGYEKDLSRISYEDVLNEFKKFKNREKYIISNNPFLTCITSRSFNQKMIKEEINHRKNNLSQEDRFVSSNNKSDQIIIMLGNQTCSRRDDEYLALKVLESHLSYGMSSVLFKLFREKNGITYDVGVFNPVREGNAPFLVYLSVSNKNGVLAFKLLSDLWRNLLSSLITNEDIYLAEVKLKSSFLISNQSLEEILQSKIQLISYGISDNLTEDLIKKTREVSPEKIQKLIQKYFCKPYLSINGEEKICNEIREQWMTNFLN